MEIKIELSLSRREWVGKVQKVPIILISSLMQKLNQVKKVVSKQNINAMILSQLTEDGHTLKIGLSALQHVGEEIRQEIDLATTLLQRLVELIVLGMLRITKNAIQKNVQVRRIKIHVMLSFFVEL